MNNKDEKRETVPDIVAEMRHGLDKSWHEIDREWARSLPDRIEAAWKREKAKAEADALAVGGIVEAARTTEKSSAVGNAAAMREALEVCFDFIMRLDRVFNPFMQNLLENAIAKAKAALSAPARNCDVEYADRVEMYYAFKDWCHAKGHTIEPLLASDAFDWLFAPARSGKRKEARSERE